MGAVLHLADEARMNDQTNTAPAPRSAACDRWVTDIVVRMFELIHRFEPDNFDYHRYRDISPAQFFYEDHANYFLFFNRNAAGFFAARELLADNDSRALFDQLLLFRLLGHRHVRLPFNTPEALSFPSITDSWIVGESSDDDARARGLALFAVPLDGEAIRMECWSGNVAADFLFRQYFFDRNEQRIAPAKGDYVLDAGGCFGDTALGFAHEVKSKGRVYTFDPLKRHCEIMRRNFAMNPQLATHIQLFEVGLSDEDNQGSHSRERDNVINPGARVAAGGDLPTRTIDSLVNDGAIPRLDFIKMDIEGSELAALVGGERSIRRWKPKLAISLYHHPEEIFAIPLWIDSLECGYRFFLDHYSIHNEETVLYAVATN